jgi:hypothetical protein
MTTSLALPCEPFKAASSPFDEEDESPFVGLLQVEDA